MKGGLPIASGGFGCVFDPALKCKNKNDDYDSTKISKLMTHKNAIEEYTEIMKFKDILIKIPNYKKYFILDVDYCVPGPLSSEDIKVFDDKCRNFNKMPMFSAENMKNENVLKELLILNMKNGGINIEKYLSKKELNAEKLYILFFGIKDLINNAIIPMNKLGVYHFDLKPANIVIDLKNQMRIIDWGLSDIVKNTSKPIKILEKSLQFNNPISCILANNESFKLYDDFLKTSHPMKNLKKYASDYYEFWTIKKGLGHFEYLQQLYSNIFKNKINSKSMNNIIIENIYTYLKQYTNFKTKTFYKSQFMKDMYNDIDIYGILTSLTMLFHKEVEKNIVMDTRNKIKFMEMVYSMVERYIILSFNIIDIEKLNYELDEILHFLKPKINTAPDTNFPSPPPPHSETVNQYAKGQYIKTTKKSIKKSTKKLTKKPTKKSIKKTNKPNKKRNPRCPNGSRRNYKTKKCNLY